MLVQSALGGAHFAAELKKHACHDCAPLRALLRAALDEPQLLASLLEILQITARIHESIEPALVPLVAELIAGVLNAGRDCLLRDWQNLVVERLIHSAREREHEPLKLVPVVPVLAHEIPTKGPVLALHGFGRVAHAGFEVVLHILDLLAELGKGVYLVHETEQSVLHALKLSQCLIDMVHGQTEARVLARNKLLEVPARLLHLRGEL